MPRRKSVNDEKKSGELSIKSSNISGLFSFYFHSLVTSDRVLYARKGGEDVAATAANLGGDKITVEEAIVSVLHPPLTNLTFHGRN